MGYRDETETLRARVEELEGELDEARATIARLTGEGGASATEETTVRSTLLDAPRSVRLARELDLEVDDEGLAAVAAIVRERLGVEVTQVGRSLTGTGFELTARGGVTRVAVTADMSGVPVQALVASTFGGGFSAMAAGAVVHDLFYPELSEAALFGLLPFGAALAFLGFRRVFQRHARARARSARACFEAVIELARRHRSPGDARRVRVAVSEEAGDEVELEVDGAAEAEAG